MSKSWVDSKEDADDDGKKVLMQTLSLVNLYVCTSIYIYIHMKKCQENGGCAKYGVDHEG